MKRSMEDTLAFVTGAGAGMLAMFLLDPACGARRRRQLAAVSREAWDATSETVGPVVGSIAEGASRLGRNVVETVGDYGTRAGEAISDYSSRIGHAAGDYSSRIASSSGQYLSDTGDAIAEGSNSLWHRGKRFVGAEPEPTQVPLVPAAIGGFGLLALGAAAVWLFDPDQGEARRHWLRDKTFSILRDAGDLARKTGRHIANQSYGAYAETRRYLQKDDATDEQLEARVRSELGRVVSNMSDVIVSARGGYVTLSGRLPQAEIPAAEACVRSVRGVRELSVLLQPHVPQPQSGLPSAGGSGI